MADYAGNNAVEHGHRLIGELLRYRERIARHRTRLTIEPERARESVMLIGGVLPASIDENSPLIRTLREATRYASGRQVRASMCPGCLEMRVYSSPGIPSVAFGPGPVEQMPGPTSTCRSTTSSKPPPSTPSRSPNSSGRAKRKGAITHD